MQIQNKLLSGIFNTFDFPVRLIYAHVRPIRKLLYNKLYSSDYQAMYERFLYFKSLFDKFNIALTNKTILETGPGNSRIPAYLFLLHGADKIILVDKYPLNAFQDSANSELDFKTDKLQAAYFKNEQNFIIEKFGKEKAEALFEKIKNEKLIEYIAADLSELSDTTKADIIISNSVFEHIKHPENSIKASARILKQGGTALHSIDLRDHYNFSNPFLFYKYSDKIWNKYLTKLGISYTNRVRYNDFIKMFTDAGFSILYEHTEQDKLRKHRIHPQFKGRNDLEITHLDILLKNKTK